VDDDLRGVRGLGMLIDMLREELFWIVNWVPMKVGGDNVVVLKTWFVKDSAGKKNG
jgi:hypothetical protein